MEYPEETIQSQYAASPTINALVQTFNETDPQADEQLFYDNIFNPDTAKGVGLDIWARIVAMQREITISSVGDILGFLNSNLQPFDQGIFYNGIYYTAGTYTIPDYVLRDMIFWKARANIGNVTLQGINKQMTLLFSGLTTYTHETGTMELTVKVFGTISQWQTLMFAAYKSILFGAGVKVNLQQLSLTVLSFHPRTGNTFGHSTFYNG